MRAFLLGLVLCFPSAALAQDSDPPVAAHAQVLPETIIHGTPQRPHVYVFLPRARVRFDHTDRAHHALDQIVESVTRAPF